MCEELKPCPFCGYDKPTFERMGTSGQSCIVVCGNCGCRHESGDEYLQSGSSWNERASLPDSAGEAMSDECAHTELGSRAYRAAYDAGYRARTVEEREAAPHPVGSALTEAAIELAAQTNNVLVDEWGGVFFTGPSWNRFVASLAAAPAPAEEGCECPNCANGMGLCHTVEAAAPAPAVKGYHPGVSGEATAEDNAIYGAIAANYFAAPSHPPATAAQRFSCYLERDFDKAPCDRDCGKLRCMYPSEPAVAVQAEPAEAGITIYPGSHPTNPGGWNIHMKGHGCVAQMPSFTANPEARAAQERYRDLIVSALAAHPKPAAPATADDAVSEQAIGKLWAKARNGRSTYDEFKAGILALRSGASAQPAEGGAK